MPKETTPNTCCGFCQKPLFRRLTEMRKSKSGLSFCNKSCSAKYNNREVPKRSLTKKCKICQAKIPSSRTYCGACWKSMSRGMHNWSKVTLGDLASAARYQMNARARQLARRFFAKRGSELKCVVCGYTKKVDVCHKTALSEFPKDTLLSVANAPENLVPLCPNHHWEFDHQQLAPEEEQLVRAWRP